jgi:hypothetical protein
MDELAQIGARVLRFLSKGPASTCIASSGGKMLVEAVDRGAISLDEETLDRLVARGLLLRSSDCISLSREGTELARQLGARKRATASPEVEIGTVAIETENGFRNVLANLSESPLAQLTRMKTKAGKAFLSTREFEAGERLRSDYTRGQLMPRMGANWIASVASGRRAGGGVAELTDAALGARLRVEGAIYTVGPELSGVLLDVCCFLKGLEQVEMERGWPVRSAKVVLKTALGVLARHYFPEHRTDSRSSRKVLHWGSEDYRPSISGQ